MKKDGKGERGGHPSWGRLSPITLGLSTLMIAVLCVAALVFARARRQTHANTLANLERDQALTKPTVPAPPAPIWPAPRPVNDPAPAPAPVIAEAAPTFDAGAPAEDGSATNGEVPSARRATLITNHNRRLEEADAQVFEAMRLPEDTRASIRRINDEYRKWTELGAQTLDVAGGVAASNARQDALRLLLGETPAKDFDGEERGAIRRLRGKYRFEWGRQLRQ
jgi:hypothetical protein